jgi:hypothetical protein
MENKKRERGKRDHRLWLGQREPGNPGDNEPRFRGSWLEMRWHPDDGAST